MILLRKCLEDFLLPLVKFCYDEKFINYKHYYFDVYCEAIRISNSKFFAQS